MAHTIEDCFGFGGWLIALPGARALSVGDMMNLMLGEPIGCLPLSALYD